MRLTRSGRAPVDRLVAVQRFTGRGITTEDLERIEAADIAFRIAGRE